MKKLVYKNREIDHLILDEIFINGIKWIDDNDGPPTNLEIDIDCNGQENMCNDFDFMSIKTHISFSLVIEAKFCFEFKAPYTIGGLEITSFSYNYDDKRHHDTIEFKFDFSPVGYIKFNCLDFYFEIIE